MRRVIMSLDSWDTGAGGVVTASWGRESVAPEGETGGANTGAGRTEADDG